MVHSLLKEHSALFFLKLKTAPHYNTLGKTLNDAKKVLGVPFRNFTNVGKLVSILLPWCPYYNDGFIDGFLQVHMVPYQCSPLSTPDGIVRTFNECENVQKSRNKDRFVAAVVLDEVGLAEDSKLLPLKALHPLLEDGTCGDDDSRSTQDIVPIKDRVAFVGISNWALDPAKMNRG